MQAVGNEDRWAPSSCVIMSRDEPFSSSGPEVPVGLETVISFPSLCSELLESSRHLCFIYLKKKKKLFVTDYLIYNVVLISGV